MQAVCRSESSAGGLKGPGQAATVEGEHLLLGSLGAEREEPKCYGKDWLSSLERLPRPKPCDQACCAAVWLIQRRLFAGRRGPGLLLPPPCCHLSAGLFLHSGQTQVLTDISSAALVHFHCHQGPKLPAAVWLPLRGSLLLDTSSGALV